MASSPPHSPARVSSDTEMLTPSRKVKALLAQFDDSDSDDAEGASNAEIGQVKATTSNTSVEQGSSDSEEDVPVARKSRMAARLEHSTGTLQEPTELTELLLSQPSDEDPEDDGDDVSVVPIRRRLLTKRKSSPAAPSSPPSADPAQPPSPMFFPSPTRSQKSAGTSETHRISEDGDQAEDQAHNPKSRFMALVEKQRKLRAEKEAAEEAKRAAREPSVETPASTHKRQRGSSPGDDSHESSQGSDAEAARKIAKRAKPTRKASKKAVEEMKRETQRLSRSMQLAHQAKTKKKFSIEGFIASFNGATKASSAASSAQQETRVATSSSAAESDSERSRRHTTPPTSPLQEPQKESVDAISGDNATVELVQEAPSLAEIGLKAVLDNEKGKGKADAPAREVLREDFVVSRAEVRTDGPRIDPPLSTTVKRQRLSELLRDARASSPDDGEDDLEIVTAKGDLRKIAAFENLPKHKAKETGSHLALRTLAHLHAKQKDPKSSMTAAELQSSLRKAARLQAQAERQQKLDELRARGVIIQTAEERERDQQEVEDLVEKARQEAAEISKREKERAKKDGTFVKDALDDDDSDDDEDFAESEEDAADSEAEDSEGEEMDHEEDGDLENEDGKLFDDQADDEASDEEAEASEHESDEEPETVNDEIPEPIMTPAVRKARNMRILSDDEDDIPAVETPKLPQLSKTPQTIIRSNRKQIPGMQMSDDLPLGLTQAFDATMAESQSQEEPAGEQDSLDYVRDLPSPGLTMVPRLNRLESLDLVTDSQPATQTQPLNINLSFSQSQVVPESPSISRQVHGTQATPSQAPFEPTQDGAYVYSPFHGNRFTTETPTIEPRSTIDTVPLHDAQASPILLRKGRLRRGHGADEDEMGEVREKTAFEIMRRAAKEVDRESFDRTKSKAKDVVDEAAEESDDEYAGLGGASDDENTNDVEDEDDRRLIDDDTQVGKGDEAALAGFYADRERKSDEAAVNKLYQEIKTGKLRNRRGVNGELDLSDEEDAAARRRESKRREFAKMRRELLKDEAVGKIAEDKKKGAFLRSIEDREQVSDDEDDLDASETQGESQSQSQILEDAEQPPSINKRKRPLEVTSESQLNRLPPALRRSAVDKKPSTLAEIQESLSFLIEGDSQTGNATLDLSDSEDEPEKYVNLDRHFDEAVADENAEDEDAEGLGDFIVDDDESANEDAVFKKPSLPSMSLDTSRARLDAGLSRRRTRGTVINRLSTLQRASSSSASTKLAFVSATGTASSTFKVPSLLRRATTNSSLSSLNSSSNQSVSATGVTTTRAERGHVSQEKVFVRKGMGGRRNAVNYQAGERPKQSQSQQDVGKSKKSHVGGKGTAKAKGGFLGDLLGRSDTWG